MEVVVQMRGSIVRILLWIAIAFLAADIAMASSGTQAALPIGDAGRVRINFNADWRFKLGATEHAEQTDSDDARWESVGLPHSFSIPYFRASAFYTGDGWYRKSIHACQRSPRTGGSHWSSKAHFRTHRSM